MDPTFFTHARPYFFDPHYEKWNYGRFAQYCYTNIPNFPTETSYRQSLVQMLWRGLLDEIATCEPDEKVDMQKKMKAAQILIALYEKRVDVNVINANLSNITGLVNINSKLKLENSNVHIAYKPPSSGVDSQAPTEAPPVCEETQISPPPYDVVSATHPKSQTPSFSEFDNLSGDSDLPSTTVLSPVSIRQLSPCGESVDYVHPQLELGSHQFDNLTVHRGTKRKASTPEESTKPKRRRLYQHEGLEDTLPQRSYVGEKPKLMTTTTTTRFYQSQPRDVFGSISPAVTRSHNGGRLDDGSDFISEFIHKLVSQQRKEKDHMLNQFRDEVKAINQKIDLLFSMVEELVKAKPGQ